MSWSRKKLLRASLISVGVVVLSILLLLGAVSLAIYSEAGSRRISQLVFDRLNQLEDFELRVESISGNLLSGLTLTDVALTLPAAAIEAGSLRASWNPYSVLSGSFYLSELEIKSLSINVIDDPEAEPTDIKSLLQLEALPINVAVGRLSVSGFELYSGGQQFQFDELALGAELNGQRLSLNDLHFEAPPLVLDLELQIELQGDLPLQATVNWAYQGELFAGYELAVGTAAITGDIDNLIVQHQLKAPEVLHSEGRILSALSFTDLSIDFTHTAASLRLPFEGMEGYLLENSRLRTRWAGADLQLNLESNVESDSLPPLQIAASANLLDSTLQIESLRVATDSGFVGGTGAIDWAEDFQLTFDFDFAEPEPARYLQSSLPVDLKDILANGHVELQMRDDVRHITLQMENFRGLIGDYELSGQTSISMVDDSIQINRLVLNTIDNQIEVTGNYSDEIHIDWKIDAPALNQLLPDFSGAVTGTGKIDGPLEKLTLSAQIESQGLEYGDFFVSAIALSLAGDQDRLRGTLTLEDIDVHSEGATQRIDQVQLLFNGNLAQHDLRANLDSEFGDLIIGLSGGVADSSVMLWRGVLNEADIRSDFGDWTKQGGPTALTLSQDSLSIPEICWQQSQTQVCAQLNQQDAALYRIAASLKDFPLRDFNESSGSESLLIDHPAFPHLPRGITLEGLVSANLSGVVGAGTEPQLSFDLAASQARLNIVSIVDTDEAISEELEPLNTQQYNWDVFTVRGTLENSSWDLVTNAELSQQNIEGTDLGLRGLLSSNLRIDEEGNLSGSANTSFEELGWIQAFLPDLSAITGSLSGEVIVSGSLSAPLFAGEFGLINGSASLDRFGVSFTEINTRIQAQNTGRVQLSGALNSDTGDISFNGEIENLYNPSRQMQLRLNGDAFHLVNLPDLNLEVSPRLTLDANSQRIHLSGNLDIPVLNMVLRELPESAVDISRDTVVIDYPADKPELARSIAASQNTLFDIPVSAEINLTLGDAVTVSGFGMNAKLDGDLNIQQQADGRNLTYGELTVVEGSYRMYGQTLNLRQGKLLFFGAVDNPALDIRATREAEGVTVGVLMNGTLKNIRSQLFSTPALPDNDIIAVLVTGRPASQLGEQDNTAVLGAIASLGLDRGEGLTTQIRDTLGLDSFGINSTGNINSSMLSIGKYLTPDIFIHYGIGLFDRQSKVAIDYSLTERIKLQAESGQFQSLDITYRVER